MKKALILIAMVSIALTGVANAGTDVSSDIATSTHWTKAGHPYHLKTQIYVLPGATLTIDPGVVVASYAPDQGSLAVCRDARIYVNGTQDEPVIMTSAEDVNTWDGSVVTKEFGFVTDITDLGNPYSGTWRTSCLEWGNLTIMGNGMISASHYDDAVVTYDIDDDGVAGGSVTTITNSECPNDLNRKVMEGLTPAFTGDPKVLYGGGDDDDDSGSISYLSLRYGGKVVALTNELNGLSLGAIGRGTDISYVDIMNNVDDGIEIWGGTVQLDHVNIWNIGDDSFDVDEGWRGSAEYGLIVQGYSIEDKQGSGVGDNCLEIDGAEDSYAQPVTTAKISHFTVVGQPGDVNSGGDGGTAWRDNARVQYDSCVWMDLDDYLVKFDCQDGDGANGYDGDANDATKLVDNTPPDGTLNWADHWTTTYNQWVAGPESQVSLCSSDINDIYGLYISIDPDGNLCQITNSVVYNIAKNSQATARGVFDSGNNNIQSSSMPIQGLTRAPFVRVWDAYDIAPVTNINPCAANDALKADGSYSGGFSGCYNWLEGWTAASHYGMTDVSMNDRQSDLNCDGGVDFEDQAVLASEWLEGK